MFSYLLPFFKDPTVIVILGVLDILTLLGIAYSVYKFIKGPFPAIYRLGKLLKNRKIAIFSDGSNATNMKAIFVDSGLFLGKNIKQLNEKDIESVKDISLITVHWSSCKSYFQKIIDAMPDNSALIIYAPANEGPIDRDNMIKIHGLGNTVVTNFRGRLLNDVLTSAITTSP